MHLGGWIRDPVSLPAVSSRQFHRCYGFSLRSRAYKALSKQKRRKSYICFPWTPALLITKRRILTDHMHSLFGGHSRSWRESMNVYVEALVKIMQLFWERSWCTSNILSWSASTTGRVSNPYSKKVLSIVLASKRIAFEQHFPVKMWNKREYHLAIINVAECIFVHSEDCE